MKSQVNVLLHVFEGLLLDARRTYPDEMGLSLDNVRITRLVQTRGLGLFTLDLPSLNSLLLRGLESGRLSLEGPLCKAVSKRIRVPRLFSGLWLRVFDKQAYLRQDADVNSILILRQLCCLGKKIQVACSPLRFQSTLEKYHDVERDLRPPTAKWEADSLGIDQLRNTNLSDCIPVSSVFLPLLDESQVGDRERDNRDRFLLERCQRVADIVAESLGDFSPVEYSTRLAEADKGIGFRHGPGAVAERLRQWDKSRFPYWPAKLEGIFPFHLSARMPLDDRVAPLNHEVPSRLIAVPKTAKGPRLIAAEPVAHQWCQQLMWRWLSDRIRFTLWGRFVDFCKQSYSSDLVLRASLDRNLATVDLSDASDRLSCWTVERMFRANSSILAALHAARTRYVRDDLSHVPGFLKTKKFASQGTAVTFPVQSLVFLVIALACSLDDNVEISKRNLKRLTNRVRVYGDDIILPKHGYGRLCRVMGLLQLKVNQEKSYVHGHFRESCGQDGFKGYCVTPVKPKTIVGDNPAAVQAVIDTANNFHLKGFWHASDNLLSTLDHFVRKNLRVVGTSATGFSGLLSFCGSDESHLRKRWDKRLHRYEGRIWKISSQSNKETREGYHTLLDFCSAPFNPSYARTVGMRDGTRKTRSRLSWEPLNMDAHRNVTFPKPGCRQSEQICIAALVGPSSSWRWSWSHHGL